MSFLNISRAFLKRQRQTGEATDVERNRSLRVFLNDMRCELVISDSRSGQTETFERLADQGMEPQALLAAAMASVSPELEKLIGNVQVFIDDPEMSVVDSRQAKLSHFEGRALAEFGKYQLGGKPVCFASHRFGATSAAETEKRVVAYVPEDRLSSVLFALGKLARFTTFFGPWSLQPLLAGESEETRAQLTIHADYSTLTVANDAAGAIAVRQLPVGTAKLAAAYAGAHGIAPHEAMQALAARSRLTTQDWPPPADAPMRHTGSFLALAPVMENLSGEIATTGDYFEFQRLAGRASELRLSLLGARITGFATWLTDMLQISVAEVEPPREDQAPVLNLLEGMRTGLLKIGNQHFDFVGGRFVPSAVQPGGAGSEAGISARWKNASSEPLKLEMFKPYAKPAGAAALALGLLAAVYPLLLSPIAQESENSFNLYANTLTRMAQAAPVHVSAQPSAEPVLWAKDVMAVGATMPYDMKLTRMALTAATGGTPGTFEVTGTLPKGGMDNLQLIGRFMKRLGASAALHRRFPEIAFAGAGQSDAKAGDDKTSDESQFRLTAKVAAGVTP
jgi:predicted Zn-dependent protease with MMP-like domain